MLSVRITDVVSRYGGEEFAILLIECGRKWVEKIAYGIKENVGKTVFKISDLELRITVVQQLEKLMNMLIKHCIMQKT